MPKISVDSGLLLAHIPGFLFARFSIDKAALFVSGAADPNAKNSSKFSLTASSHHNETGNRTDCNDSLQAGTWAPLGHSEVLDLQRSKLHASHATITQRTTTSQTGLNRPPSTLVASPPKSSSTLSELLTVANPNSSAFGLTPKNGTKVDAQRYFFQASGLSEGDACKRIGFFRFRGCALGCTCAWYEHCGEGAEDTPEYIKVGICVINWKVPLLCVLLLCCGNACLILACLSQEDPQEEVEQEDSPYPSSPAQAHVFHDFSFTNFWKQIAPEEGDKTSVKDALRGLRRSVLPSSWKRSRSRSFSKSFSRCGTGEDPGD